MDNIPAEINKKEGILNGSKKMSDDEKINELTEELNRIDRIRDNADVKRVESILSQIDEIRPFDEVIPDNISFDEFMAGYNKKQKEKMYGRMRRIKVAAAFSLILFISIGLVDCMVYATRGQRLHSIITGWANEFVVKKAGNSYELTDDVSSKTFRNFDEFMSEYDVDIREPLYMPEGFTLESISVNDDFETGNLSIFMAHYLSGEDFISFSFELISDEHDIRIEKAKGSTVEFTVENIIFYEFSNTDWPIISWMDKDFDYMLCGSVENEELKKIIYSMYNGRN